MKRKKIILVIFLIVCILIFLKSNAKKRGIENTIDEIENEAYYKEKEEEFLAAEDEYDEVLTEYINEEFSDEDKQVLADYNKKMTKAVNDGNKEEKITVSHEKTEYIKEVSKKKFSEEQLKKLEEIQECIDELEPIVDEYAEKLADLEEKQFWEDRITLSNGIILNEREKVISDKECNGLKFTQIGLRYVPTEKCTKFAATVSNISNEAKEEKISVKTTGDVETIFPLNIEKLETGESYSFEIEIYEDISMANTLEIVEYNEQDYEV